MLPSCVRARYRSLWTIFELQILDMADVLAYENAGWWVLRRDW